MIHVPQRDKLAGSDIFSLRLDGKLVDILMISCPGVNMSTGYWKKFYKIREGNRKFTPCVEVIFGLEKHDSVHEDVGTQPFGSYYRGHVYRASDPQHAEDDNQRVGVDYVMFQNYWRSPHFPGKSFALEHAKIAYCGIRAMLKLGYIKPDTPIYLQDHSRSWGCYRLDQFWLMSAENATQAFLLLLKTLPDQISDFESFFTMIEGRLSDSQPSVEV